MLLYKSKVIIINKNYKEVVQKSPSISEKEDSIKLRGYYKIFIY
jgi:hypothetical protein